MFKNIWPTKKQKAKLRSEGRNYYNPFINKYILISVIIMYFYNQKDRFQNQFDIYSNALIKKTDLLPVQLLGQEFLAVIMELSGMIVICLIVANIAQSKFSFFVKLLSFNTDRLGFRNLSTRYNIFKLISYICISVVSVIWLLAFVFQYTKEFLELFSLKNAETVDTFSKLLSTFSLNIATVALILLPIIFAITWLSFHLEHRMSNEELQKELSESQEQSIKRI